MCTLTQNGYGAPLWGKTNITNMHTEDMQNIFKLHHLISDKKQCLLNPTESPPQMPSKSEAPTNKGTTHNAERGIRKRSIQTQSAGRKQRNTHNGEPKPQKRNTEAQNAKTLSAKRRTRKHTIGIVPWLSSSQMNIYSSARTPPSNAQARINGLFRELNPGPLEP